MKNNLSIVARDAAWGDTAPAPLPDVAWEPPVPGQRRVLNSWNDYMALASRVVGRFHGQFKIGHFDYEHPTRLQPGTPRRLKKPYKATVAYTEWGPADAPVLLCCGGVANVAVRFHYLASDLSDTYRVICMDWLGRGRSGWLASEGDYSLSTYAEQMRQAIVHLGGRPVSVLGSSMGGSAAIEMMAKHRGLVRHLILNDVGPHIPARRRKRRADAIARHYVFRNPSELLRRVGASGKNDGPVSDDIRFNLTFHQTRWSDEEDGRIYRHDVRAMQAYRHGAQRSVVQWHEWKGVHCPVLLIHGMESDALFEPTIRRMSRHKDIMVMHVPDTGHTPLLADRNHIDFIRQWLDGRPPEGREWSVLHAPSREAFPGNPIPFAPMGALR
ncbi:alpha/beta fold hydrolase [Ideonella sp. A 288]|uniref:alpha/beta fold hydrolase n=1 Tax=Ideonella sp. A 288 TaxID=1962181 RepID=UPI0013030C79|nr:alpha/beta hydrolase [Ideonella sp. A 288]